ncbi:hypothetical protein QTL86_03415 [Cellulosilyticum sp. ST5]|uniref:hypothetical protein n=1 Tax=Cellulosilyticum sp. ST5 TaxID=3055805 RepID=UPI0039774A85
MEKYVKCDKILCVYNQADTCIKSDIELISGKCLDYEQGENTGAIIDICEEESKQSKCNTCINKDDGLSGECYDCIKGIRDYYVML